MSLLSETLKQGKFAVTSEVGPPKGINVEHLLEEAKRFGEKVVGINVTDIQSSVMRVGSLAISKILLENGLEPIYQITLKPNRYLTLTPYHCCRPLRP